MKLESLRKKIDEIDARILELVNRRAEEAKRIGALKARAGSAVYVPHREKALITTLKKKNNGSVSNEAVEAVFREIINACRSLEDRIKIAFLGPEATFSHLAALKNFGVGADYVPVSSIKDVFTEVEKGRADYGVVPIENSTEGIINHTLDMFMDSDLYICAEISLPIELYLLSRSGITGKIKEVFSHPQPLAQCRNWLEANLPGVPVTAVASTTDACRKAAQNAAVAAVASQAAATLYKLEVCAKGIEDSKENITRFFVVGRTSPECSGQDKTSVMLSLKDRVGALHSMLLPFKKHKINLTKIESRPTRKKAWEYLFFIDFLGHVGEPRIKQVLHELEHSCGIVKVLGSYPRAD